MLYLSITPRAESDLIDIWIYTHEQWGAGQADKYLDQLDRGMQQLIEFPALGMDYSYVLPDCLCLFVAHHAVFYQVFEPEVRIIRVLHKSMDVPQRLFD